MPVSFGVHVGRTSMCLAVEKDGRCDVVANDAGDRVTPAIVGWTEDEVLVGLSAKQLSSRKPNSIAVCSKSKIETNDTSDYVISGDGFEKSIKVEDVHTRVYKYMKEIAISHASEDVSSTSTVITVPLEFTSGQRAVVAKCANQAGFKVAQVISEPAAAVMAYGVGQNEPTSSYKCIVFRCGGTSLTCSLVSVTSGMISVEKSVTKNIGGDIITELLIEQLASEFKRKHKVDPRETKRGKLKLKLNAENVKHVLSTLETANCYIESLYEGIDFNANVSRSRFEIELSKISSKFIAPIKEILEDVSENEVDKVILSGGTSKIPKLQKIIADMFSNAEVLNAINTDEVIAVGAANQASLIMDKDSLEVNQLNDNGSFTVHATTLSIVYQLHGKEEAIHVLIPSKCPIPVRRSHHLSWENDGTLAVKLFLQKADKSLLELAELTLQDGDSNGDSKPSLSAHIHRDGGIHIALTDKSSSKCDEVTIPAPK